MSYLFHFLIALVVAVAYFSLQADFSIELKKQKTLFILTACVFVATFAVAYICIKPKTSVSWGSNQLKEFDDGGSFDGDDDFMRQQPNELPQQGGFLPQSGDSIPQIPAMPSQTPFQAPNPVLPGSASVPQASPTLPNLPTM